MKNMKLTILGIVLAGVMWASAQPTDARRTHPPQWQQHMADLAAASTKAAEQGDKFAAATDYLRMALVLGLGMLIGRMSAVSHRELTEVKATLTRLAGSNSQ